MREYIKLIRIKHYIKNFLIFIPLFFSGNFFNIENIGFSLLGFLAFSFLASAIYIINDIFDIEKDKSHPIKKERPLASGKIPILNAIILACFMLFLVFTISVYFFNVESTIYLVLYFVLNLAYSFKLKEIPLVDILILVSGFVIRVLFGASIVSIVVSNWLYLTVMSFAFYLSFGKRRNELIKKGDSSRKVLRFYNKEFLDKIMYVTLTLGIVFYSLWATDIDITSKSNNLMIWTIPIIIIIFTKYSMIVESDSYGDPVDVILSSPFIIATAFIYAVYLFSVLYMVGLK